MKKNILANKNAEHILYAQIIRRVGALLIDLFIWAVFFLLCLYLVSKLYSNPIIQKVYTEYVKSTTSNTVSSLVSGVSFSYLLTFALYTCFSLLIFNRTVGMAIVNIRYVTSDQHGIPRNLSIPQKFLRGFVCTMLSLLLAFIPSIVWPFDKYYRSLNDRLAGTFVVQDDQGWIRTYVSYAVIVLLLLLYFFSTK